MDSPLEKEWRGWHTVCFGRESHRLPKQAKMLLHLTCIYLHFRTEAKVSSLCVSSCLQLKLSREHTTKTTADG